MPSFSIIDYLAHIGVDHNTAQRPTEAQIRWAFIHRAERVRATKDQIDRLMKFPPNVSDVDGAYLSDGNSTVADADGDGNDDDADNNNMPEYNGSAKAYLGVRRNRDGKWIRRHISQTRFPRLGSRSMQSSSQTQNEKQLSVSASNAHSNNTMTMTIMNPPRNDRKRNKVVISKGRRALLRVSARAHERRKRHQISYSSTVPDSWITQCRNPESMPTVAVDNDLYYGNNSFHQIIPAAQEEVFGNACRFLSEEESAATEKDMGYAAQINDEISASSTTSSKEISASSTASSRSKASSRKSKSRKSKISIQNLCVIDENEKRICRFEEAYNAIMLATNANFQDDEIMSVSTKWLNSGGKRWTRDPTITSAVSIDGRLYADLQRTPTVSLKQMKGTHDHDNGQMMHDRAATWLVHVPNPRDYNPSCDTGVNGLIEDNRHAIDRGEALQEQEPLSACQQKLIDIESKIQMIEDGSNIQLSIDRGNAPEQVLNARQKKLFDIGSKIQGIENCSNLKQMQNLHISAKGIPAPLNYPSTASPKKFLIGKASMDTVRETYPNAQMVISDICNEDREQDVRSSKSSSIPTPSVGTSTLRRLFAGVPHGAKKLNHTSASRPKSQGGRNTISQPPGPCHAGVPNGTKKSNQTNDSHPKSQEGRNANSQPPGPSHNMARKLNEPVHSSGSAEINVLDNSERTEDSKAHTTKSVYEKYMARVHPGSVSSEPAHSSGRAEISVLDNSERTEDSKTNTTKSVYEKYMTRVHQDSVSSGQSEVTAAPLDGTKGKTPDLIKKYEGVNEGRFDFDERDNHLTKPISLPDDNLHDEIVRSISDQSQQNVISDQSQPNIATFVKESLANRFSLPSIIDTDGTESSIADFDDAAYAAKMRSMLMSPSLITKRYRQAMDAIESRNWNQISFLVNANPWLIEMKDVTTDQSLVHSLSLFGGGLSDADEHGSVENTQQLPEQLVRDIIEYEPNVVHKLDVEGNLPLHMAAASGNIVMIRELGQRFSSAASVQNHHGLLPLHLAIMSCAMFATGIRSVELILALFPGAVVVKDNDGNTPLHNAAGTLRGDVGADVINHLVKGCHDLMLENGTFFDNHMRSTVDEASTAESSTGMLQGDLRADSVFYMAKNKEGETPLVRAIKSLAGRPVVEALLGGMGGQLALHDTNYLSQNALHLALHSEFHDAAVVLSILKSTPITATIVDGRGMLPIQLACSNALQREIILAIAIIDLPIDLGAKEHAVMRDGFGASWWYLVCDSDDMHADIVKEILSLCSYPQKIALCLSYDGNMQGSRVAATCATPLCDLELKRSLRLFGRFEFIGGEKKNHVFSRYVQTFDAVDYGTIEDPMADEIKVSLVCYTDAKVYGNEAQHLQHGTLDTRLFEEVSHFTAAEMEANIPSGVSLQYCVTVNKSTTSLASVVAGMPSHRRAKAGLTVLGRYFVKIRSIMHRIAQALKQMHAKSIIHGRLDPYSIGKFDGKWKIAGLPGSILMGGNFTTSRLGLHSPPDAFVLAHSKHSHQQSVATLAPSLTAEPNVDVWAFGKLLYEVLVGESLFIAFSDILVWDDIHLSRALDKLLEERIGSTGVDLIACCLCPMKSARAKSMSDIVKHPFWKDANAFNLG